MNIIEWLFSDAGRAAGAGALGGVVRWITLRNNWREGIATLIVGAICAMYLGPLVFPIIEPVFGRLAPDSNVSGLASFLVGMGGITLTSIILDIFERRKKGMNGNGDA